jgi:regulator of protease activity HflC (stomatin/prohibitin superfamily)
MIDIQRIRGSLPVVTRLLGAAFVLSAVVVAGCDNAADEQNKATAAKQEADQKIAAASKEADDKAKAAVSDADKKIAEAQAGFTKLREDYRHTTVVNLADLDKKIADLTAKARTATGKTKTDLDASLKAIGPSREAFTKDYQAIETASTTNWDATKARLDKEWTELKALVDKA